MSEIGVGLIGFGLGGRVFHAPFIQHTPGLALRAVVSSDPAKVQAHHPEVAVMPTVDDLLRDEGIALVVVSSPDHLHGEHAIAALQAGKHVLVDKPFATSLADARRVSEVAEEQGRLLTVFQNRRWDADFLTLRRLLDAGELGDVVHFESHFDRWRPDVAEVWKEQRDGGSWQDLGPHLIDQAIALFGRPQAVTADIATMRAGAQAPDWFHVVLHYPAMRAILHSTKMAASHDLRFIVHGTGGSWIKHGMDTQEPALIAGALPRDEDFGRDPREGLLTFGDERESIQPANERGDYAAFWKALEAALCGKDANPVPASQALAVMEVLDAGLRSSAEGKTVAL
ncbi:oxidoreductase [Aurantiacibacter zhengii]|uniref:Oxidoreductase n=1 Tax=Aurantiacibacter zhengii TaxID=2307003 RepID=A0A418NRB5_9SPHN|nr:oxidoreductase [Aurantiacibacter zhengii]RIV85630.1 oxidoreductase [Aurantiacibacter zhengii]